MLNIRWRSRVDHSLSAVHEELAVATVAAHLVLDIHLAAQVDLGLALRIRHVRQEHAAELCAVGIAVFVGHTLFRFGDVEHLDFGGGGLGKGSCAGSNCADGKGQAEHIELSGVRKDVAMVYDHPLEEFVVDRSAIYALGESTVTL